MQYYHNLAIAILSPSIYLIFGVASLIKNQKYKRIVNSSSVTTQVFSIGHSEKMVRKNLREVFKFGKISEYTPFTYMYNLYVKLKSTLS